MSKGWTPERRARQAELIRRWRPWERSTGPTSAEGKARASRNAERGSEWPELQALRRQLSDLLREQRVSVRRFCDVHEVGVAPASPDE